MLPRVIIYLLAKQKCKHSKHNWNYARPLNFIHSIKVEFPNKAETNTTEQALSTQDSAPAFQVIKIKKQPSEKQTNVLQNRADDGVTMKFTQVCMPSQPPPIKSEESVDKKKRIRKEWTEEEDRIFLEGNPGATNY